MNETAPTNPAVFTPEVVEAINRAYDEACDIAGVQTGGQEVRLKLAEHIMFLARGGETDEHRLCSSAILAVIGRRVDAGPTREKPALADCRDGVVPPAAAPGATGHGR